MAMVNWDLVKSIGDSRALKSSFLFVLIVPIFAKLLLNIPDKIVVPLFNVAWELGLTLPFSWVLFFYASLACSIGNLIYLFRCPEVVKNYKEHSDFDKHNRNGIFIRTLILMSGKNPLMKNVENLGEQVKLNLHENGIDDVEFVNMLRGGAPVKSEHFYFIRDEALRARSRSCFLCLLSYGVALLLLLFVFAQNVWSVIKVT